MDRLDTVEMMGALVERPAGMAIAGALRGARGDALAQARELLQETSVRGISDQDLKREVTRLKRLGIVEKGEDRLWLTEEGAKALAMLLHGPRWKKHLRPGERQPGP